MIEQRLRDARDYFDNITTVAYKKFQNGPVDFYTVYALAAGLFHLHEWVFALHEQALKKRFPQLRTKGDLWGEIEKQITDAGLIRDLNNTAKHFKLSFDANKPNKGDPSTAMHYAANTKITSWGFGEYGFGEGPYGGAKDARMDEAGREVALAPIATEVFNFWQVLIDELEPERTFKYKVNADGSTSVG